MLVIVLELMAVELDTSLEVREAMLVEAEDAAAVSSSDDVYELLAAGALVTAAAELGLSVAVVEVSIEAESVLVDVRGAVLAAAEDAAAVAFSDDVYDKIAAGALDVAAAELEIFRIVREVVIEADCVLEVSVVLDGASEEPKVAIPLVVLEVSLETMVEEPDSEGLVDVRNPGEVLETGDE